MITDPLSFAIGIGSGLLIVWGFYYLINPNTHRAFKWWAVRVTEPWREVFASLDLEWRIFAQRHNAAGKRPRCWYEGMPLDPMDKVELYDECEVDPDYLEVQAQKQYEDRTINQKGR